VGGWGSAAAAASEVPRLRQAAHSTSPARRSHRVDDGADGQLARRFAPSAAGEPTPVGLMWFAFGKFLLVS
jgi:hypothetical protein